MDSHATSAVSTSFAPSGPALTPVAGKTIALANYAIFGNSGVSTVAAGSGWTLESSTSGDSLNVGGASNDWCGQGAQYQVLGTNNPITPALSGPTSDGNVVAWIGAACTIAPTSGSGGSGSNFLGISLASRNPAFRF